MKYIAFYIIVFTLIGFSSSCRKEKTKCPSEFVVYGEVLPYNETYKIGDTITLQTKYNYMIYEKNTEKYYDMRNLDIEAEFLIYRIDILFKPIYHNVLDYVTIVNNDSFKYNIETFNSGRSTLFSNIIFNDKTFFQEIKIVLNKKGLFMMVYGPFSLNNNQDFEGKCKNVSFNLFTRLNKNLDNNIDLLKDSPDEHFNTWILQKPEERFYRGGFAFRVIE
jgi:hypothetical protein